jgi:hypothetical protein
MVVNAVDDLFLRLSVALRILENNQVGIAKRDAFEPTLDFVGHQSLYMPSTTQ